MALVRHRRIPELGYGRCRGRGLPVRQTLPREAGADVGDGFHDFLAEEVFANALTGRMRLLREKFGHKGRG